MVLPWFWNRNDFACAADPQHTGPGWLGQIGAYGEWRIVLAICEEAKE
jgi:hypothetical protein